MPLCMRYGPCTNPGITLFLPLVLRREKFRVGLVNEPNLYGPPEALAGLDYRLVGGVHLRRVVRQIGMTSYLRTEWPSKGLHRTKTKVRAYPDFATGNTKGIPTRGSYAHDIYSKFIAR